MEHRDIIKRKQGACLAAAAHTLVLSYMAAPGGLVDEFRNMPYELRVYEAIISTVVAIEKENYRKLKEKANVIISKFKGAVSCITNHILLLYLFIYYEK